MGLNTHNTLSKQATYLLLVRMWSQPALPAVQYLPHHHHPIFYETENTSSAVLKLYLQDSHWLTAFCSPFCLFPFHGPVLLEHLKRESVVICKTVRFCEATMARLFSELKWRQCFFQFWERRIRLLEKKMLILPANAWHQHCRSNHQSVNNKSIKYNS